MARPQKASASSATALSVPTAKRRIQPVLDSAIAPGFSAPASGKASGRSRKKPEALEDRMRRSHSYENLQCPHARHFHQAKVFRDFP